MAPYVETVHPSTLLDAVNVAATAASKKQKKKLHSKEVPPPPRVVEQLDECPLARMLQYRCQVVLELQRQPSGSSGENKGGGGGEGEMMYGRSSTPRATTVCYPVERLFRRCAGGLTVETTSWEGPAA